KKFRPLEKYADQFMGQATIWERPSFQRYSIRIVDGRFQGIMVEEWPVDPILQEEWIEGTIDTIQEIERRRASNSWTKMGQGCFAWGCDCEFKPECRFGRI